MKKLIVLLIVLLVAAPVAEIFAQPFAGHTRHKPIKRMTRRQVRDAQQGRTLYFRYKGKVEKRAWRPTTSVAKNHRNHLPNGR